MQWWKKEAVYQIYPRSFKDSNGDGIGDINGIIQKLDYIKSLGVGAIWICPIFDSPQADNGYDVKDYYNIYPEYGSMEDIENLIMQAHKRDLKVILDLVVNHTSKEHPWFIESRNPDSPYRDFYYWRKGKDNAPPNNWGAAFSESAWHYDDKSGEYYFAMFSPLQPDLNWNNPKVVEEVCNIMKFWQDKGIDGWRIDAIPYIDKDISFRDYNPEDFPKGQKYYIGKYHYKFGKLFDYINILNRKVWSKTPDFMTVAELGESFSRDEILKYTKNGDAFTMCFTFDIVNLDVDYEKGCGRWAKKDLPLSKFKEKFAYWQEMVALGGNPTIFLQNHDHPRSVSRFFDCGQYREEYAKTLAITTHMMGGTPFIYQGEEIGMTNCHFEPDEYKDIEFFGGYLEFVKSGKMSKEDYLEAAAYFGRDNARTPMQWSTAKNAGFSRGDSTWIKVNPNYKEINVLSQEKDENSILNCYRNLLELRKNHRIIQCGLFKLLSPNDEEVFSYIRTMQNQKLFVTANFTQNTVTRKMPLSLAFKKGEMIASSHKDSKYPSIKYTLRPFESMAILYK